jgi:DNA processing protein
MSEEPPPRPTSWPEGFAAGAANRAAIAVLLSLPSVTPRRLLDLADRHRRAEAVLAAIRRGRGSSANDGERARELDGHEILSAAGAAGARLVATGDREYPPALRDLSDPPAGLFVRGGDLRDMPPCVGMVGARNASPDGCEVATDIGRGLAAAGVCVVSGAARGIDTCGHRGALAAGGRTVAVLGSGVDVAYPRANAALLDRIADAGAVVSEYPPGTRAEPFRFPARNRIVAGLSRAVVIVEGAAGSGSMITADHAIDLGREVFAVPGPVTSELSHVPLALIRDGATMIRGAADLLEDLGLGPPVGPASPQRLAEAVGAIPGLDDDQRAVLCELTGPCTPELLANRTGLALPRVLGALAVLEVRRLVRGIGGRFERLLAGSAPP